MLISLFVGALAVVGFLDKTAELGLAIGADAACWVDVDNDGWVDLCVSGGVWTNKEGKKFVKQSDTGANVVAADFDSDGYADLFSWSSFQLYRNKQGKGFEIVHLPTLPKCVSRGACWGDFNGDCFVDLYVGGFEDWDADVTYPNMILTNKEGKAFELKWTETKYRTRGVTACDFDQDGDLDVYASNYRLQPNVLWQNDGTGAFKDIATELNAVAASTGFPGGHSIGAAWGDYDNDGVFDLFAGNFAHVDDRGDQPKSRFLKGSGLKGGHKFEDLGTCGVFYQESYASPAVGDYDNDGKLDLLFTTVYPVASFNKPNYPVLFHNDGKFAFADVTGAAGLAHLGATYQASWADFDKDGDLDLVSAGHLFVNQGNKNHWIELRLKGDGRLVNRSAIGAQARVKLNDGLMTRQVEAGTGEGNQNDLVMHFGLGSVKGSVEVEILWPNGQKQTVRRVRTDRVTIIEFKPR